MLPQNRTWLEEANQKLLASYKEQPPREPAVEARDIKILRMSHEDRAIEDRDYISPIFYKRQSDLIKELSDAPTTGFKSFLILAGTDGGHLLNHVLETHDIKNLVIIEPHIESFYHSLTVTDWPAMFNRFQESGGTCYFHIGEITLEIKQMLSNHMLELGAYHMANIHIAYERVNACARSAEMVVGCMQECINSLGFYDDERVGLAHSLANIEMGGKFLMKQSEPYINKPIVVCGAGPSLPEILPQIRKHRNKMFLMSCGSAIRTFFKEGIKPDFQIQQERPKHSISFDRVSGTQEFRKGITFIGLNVVHPDAHDLYDDLNFILKANDFGAIVSRQFVGMAPQAFFVNPLVSNAGLSIASILGFKNIYLAGVDCAYGKDGNAHGKNDRRPEDKEREESTETRHRIKGNFRPEVLATTHYRDSRDVIEHTIRMNPKANYYNLGDGAFFQGAKPTRKFKPRAESYISMKDIMANFKAPEIMPDKAGLQREFTSKMFGLNQVVQSIPKKIKSKSEAYFFLDTVHKKLLDLKKNENLFWHLVKGSFTTQMVFMAGCADASLEHFDRASANFREFSGMILEEIKTKLYQFDVWENPAYMPEDLSNG